MRALHPFTESARCMPDDASRLTSLTLTNAVGTRSQPVPTAARIRLRCERAPITADDGNFQSSDTTWTSSGLACEFRGRADPLQENSKRAAVASGPS